MQARDSKSSKALAKVKQQAKAQLGVGENDADDGKGDEPAIRLALRFVERSVSLT